MTATSTVPLSFFGPDTMVSNIGYDLTAWLGVWPAIAPTLTATKAITPAVEVTRALDL